MSVKRTKKPHLDNFPIKFNRVGILYVICTVFFFNVHWKITYRSVLDGCHSPPFRLGADGA
ncbi:hypothetical protein PUN4_920035 [Paraburkholderia unamae]|nr:hypothetical protein PUN4_920035 [Paraburkholderia unamae]